MAFFRMLLAVMVGAALGALVTMSVRPQVVQAQGGTAYVNSISGTGPLKIRGSRVVGVACAGSGPNPCFIVSQ